MAQGHIRKRGNTWAYVHFPIDPTSGQHSWKSGFKITRYAGRAQREAIHTREHGTFVEPSTATYAAHVTDIRLPRLHEHRLLVPVCRLFPSLLREPTGNELHG